MAEGYIFTYGMKKQSIISVIYADLGLLENSIINLLFVWDNQTSSHVKLVPVELFCFVLNVDFASEYCLYEWTIRNNLLRKSKWCMWGNEHQVLYKTDESQTCTPETSNTLYVN